MSIRTLVGAAKALGLLSCSPVGFPPGFFDLTALHSSMGWVQFGETEVALFFLVAVSIFFLWRSKQYIASHRWKQAIVISSLISVLFWVVTIPLFGLQGLWGDAIEVWHQRATAIFSQPGCPVIDVSAEYTKVLADYNALRPLTDTIASLLFCFLLIAALAYVVLRAGLGMRRGNSSR
jgi:hypothetical protein